MATLETLPPRPKEAAQLSAVLWASVVCVTSTGFIFSGQVVGVEWITVFSGAVTAFLLSALLYLLLRTLSGRSLWIAFPAALLGLVVVAALQAAADYGGQYLVHAFSQTRLPSMTRSAVLLVTVIYWALSACNLALFVIGGAMRKIRLRERELAAAEVARLKAELDTLRMQLNPHFLCNSLNVVSSLIVTGRTAEANQMAEGLAGFLQAAMHIDTPSVPLAEEMETVERYLEIEAARFGDRLQIGIHVDPGLAEMPVPSFLLQPLVENAIKHGVETTPGESRIEISARRDADSLVLAVENGSDAAGAATPCPRPGHGIGLANTRARLEMLYPGAATLEGAATGRGWRATIRLPIAPSGERPAGA